MEDLGRLKLFEYTIKLFQDGNQFFENKFKNNVLVIGREDECDLIIQDRSISRKHVRIEVDIDKFYVTDMGSSNGTFVDNVKIDGKTQINSESHIRAGKITIQVVIPEINKKVVLGDLPLSTDATAPATETATDEEPEPPKRKKERNKEDPPEMTLSKIALRVEDALHRTEHPEDVMAMVDKDFVVEMTTQHESTANFISKKIESLVLWNQQIYNIQEFGFHDTITVGPAYSDSIHIPSVGLQWELSRYEFKEAIFTVPKNLNVFALRGKNFLSKDHLVSEKRIREDKNNIQIQISHYDILRVEIDPNTSLYFRYVPSTVDLESKKLLNPDVLIKKALMTSFIMHLVLSLVFFMIPKDRLKPKEEKKPPQRLAKLIVEEKPIPPPVVIPPPEPPPPPPEEKKEEPPPPEIKKPEPPKPPPKKVEPPKPKPKPKKEIPKPVKKEPPPKPVEKASQVVQKPVAAPVQQPKGDNKPAGPKVEAVKPVAAPAPPPPPPPKPVDISKLGALAAMSGLKLDTKSTKAAPAINIAANQNTTTGAQVGMNSMTSELKSKTAGVVGGTAASGPIKTKGTGSVASGYGTEGIGKGTGKKAVQGAVIGKPTLTSGTGKTEGLSREQVLKAMQPYLGKIQSCYERSLLSDPNLTGRIEFEWKIAASGTVSSVDIKKNSVAGGEQLGECVVGVIRSIKFPSASNGQETNPAVGFPFGRL